MSGITLIPQTEASVPTPAAGKVTFFINADAADSLAYMDDARVVTAVDGATGADGAAGADGSQGPPGMDGSDGVDGEPGPPGADGSGGGSALTVEEVDGSPTDAAITKIVFPNDTVSIAGGVATVRQVPQAFIGCRAYNSTQQTLATGTPTAITFAAEDYDSDAFHDNSTNPARFTVPAGLGGKYRLHAQGYWNTAPTGLQIGYFRINGTTEVRGRWRETVDAEAAIQQSADVTLVAGDYVEWIIQQNHGSNRDLGGGAAYETIFELVKMDSGKVGAGIGAKAYRSTTQTISTGAHTAAIFSAEEFDSDGLYESVTNPSRLTVPAGLGGKYLLAGISGSWPANSTGTRITWWRKNGTTALRSWARDSAPAASDQSQSLSIVVDLAAGEYVELMLFQNSGGDLAIGHASAPEEQISASIMRLDSGSVAPMTVRGKVNSDGTVASGTGFTSTKPATGKYEITLSPAFASVPIVLLTVATTGGATAQTILLRDATTSLITVWILVDAGATFADHPFTFLAMAVA